MRVLFCYAMDHEAKPLLEASQVNKKKELGFAKLYECEYEGTSFLVLISGIGKVAAGAGLSAVLATEKVDRVFNVGVGGSLDAKKAPIRTAIIGSAYQQHDMDTSPIGDPVGLISGINLIDLPSDGQGMMLLEKACGNCDVAHERGAIASGDLFISTNEQRARIKSLFGALSCDMETAAFAQVAYCYHVPFNGLRMISDAEDAGEYAANLPYCAHKAAEIVLTLLKLC